MFLKKIAAETFLAKPPAVLVREYNEMRDKVAVEELERRCEVGQPGELSLLTDLMGDPVARVRNFISHVMLVAEYGSGGDIVGVIRGCIKTVTSGHTRPPSIDNDHEPVYVNLAYILGLRVSSNHRRLGIATKLVQELENWSKRNGAEFAYMATECSNRPSLNLFTQKCNYEKFRNPTVLVQPVHLHYKPLSYDISILRISPESAATIYRRVFSNSVFFPKDIDRLLNNKLNLGTFIALSKRSLLNWNMKSNDLPESFAILSIWDTKEVFRVKVKGVSALKHAACLGTRVLDAMVPWLKVPSVPNIFKTFGFYFLYGLHMKGKDGPRLMKNLCRFVHNLARDDADCKVVVAEVGQKDPVREAVPHWKKFSWDEDIWCIKRLEVEEKNHNTSCDVEWVKNRAKSPIVFVDPRDL